MHGNWTAFRTMEETSMRRTPQMRALMLYMTVPLIMAGVGCVKSSEKQDEQAQVQGVPATPQEQQPAASGGTAAPAGGGSAQAPSSRATTSPARTPAPAAARPAPPAPVTVAEGTDITVRTVQTLSTKTAENGQKFEVTLREPLIAGNYVVAPKGARAYGVVSNSDDGGRVKGRASLTVRLTALEVNGREVDISTSTVTHVAKGTKKEDAVKVGVGSGIGAAIGAIAGGGKGAAIGAGVGAGAGTGVVLATKGDPAVIPSETLLKFQLTAPLTVARN